VTTVNSARLLVPGALAGALLACGAKSSLDGVAVGRSPDASIEGGSPALDAATTVGSVALTLPIGTYTGCTSSTVNLAANTEAVGGGDGTVTVAVDGSGQLSAALSFAPYLSGIVSLVPTSATTAALTAGSFDARTLDWNGASVSVPVSASSLALVGDTLFVAVYGTSNDTTLHGYSRCPVPPSLPRATIVNRTPARGPFPTGTYSRCTTTEGTYSTTTMSGGDSSRSISVRGGTLTAAAAADAGFPIVCGDLGFEDLSTDTATLRSGGACTLQQPCGPPPSLGPSSAPGTATLSNMEGAMAVVSGTLFIHVVGVAPPQACGSHFVSLICPAGP